MCLYGPMIAGPARRLGKIPNCAWAEFQRNALESDVSTGEVRFDDHPRFGFGSVEGQQSSMGASFQGHAAVVRKFAIVRTAPTEATVVVGALKNHLVGAESAVTVGAFDLHNGVLPSRLS